ncbi:hypothetical protein [Marinobacter antarcticus]|uniref:hypothetical protein n=1 Tax=Marinobacter antarcticus TaxID=564117 RepID=UPI001114E9AD|nr:hypothetical protein [Marinobacter antarcticus]
MSKSRKNEIASQKDVPLIIRGSLLYGDSTSTRSLVLALPYVGSTIDLILSKRGQEFVQKRTEIFLEEIGRRLEKLESCTIEKEDEEGFFDLFQATYENVVRTRSEERIKRFARLVGNCLVGDRQWDETEAAVRLISDLTDTHIQILTIITNLRVSDRESFEGLRVISVTENKIIDDVPPLIDSLHHLSEAALKMYCSELISKGLLHDEGVGRWSTGSLDLLVPTSLADWLLEKIGECGDR